MSLNKIQEIFKEARKCDNWSIQLLHINNSKRHGTRYVGRGITLSPAERLSQFVSDISYSYIGSPEGKLFDYTEIRDYDGTVIGQTIYKLSADNDLIKDEYASLIYSISNPDMEVNPIKPQPQAYLLNGTITKNDSEYPVKFISMRKPITTFKNKFTIEGNSFKEMPKDVLSLTTNLDIIIFDNTIYMLTMAGEKLFNMERSYKKICTDKIELIKSSEILSDNSPFETIAGSGQNPRRFVAFNNDRLEQLKDAAIRCRIAEKFSIPLIGDKFNTTEKDASEKVVKLLCNKGMVDPFDDSAVEVVGSKKWA